MRLLFVFRLCLGLVMMLWMCLVLEVMFDTLLFGHLLLFPHFLATLHLLFALLASCYLSVLFHFNNDYKILSLL